MSHPASAPRRGRLRRWARRTLVSALAFLAVVTMASVVGNALTRPPDTLPAPDGGDVVVDGVRVHYRQWGSSGPEVLLVHGFAESTVSWEPMATELARTHRVTAVDLAGDGYTQYSGHYALADQTALVSGLITALGLDRPALVGHSAGAAVVGSVALTRPELVRGVVFADGDGLPWSNPDDATTNRGRMEWLLRTPWFTSGYRIVTRTGAVHQRIMRQVCGSECDGFTPTLAEAWLRPMRQGDAERSMLGPSGAGMLALTRSDVQRIRVPRAIIWGSEDESGGGSLAMTRANLGHPSERIIQHAGHLSMLAKPAGFATAVAQLTDPMR